MQQEFPILAQVTQPDAPATTIVELGAGAGNTAFPIVVNNQNPRLKLHAFDFSKKAVELMRADPRYDERVMRADVWDVAATGTTNLTPSDTDPESNTPAISEESEPDNNNLPPGLTPGSVDIVLLIFVFSALSPSQWSIAVRNIHRLLRPGGEVLLRDYARGDLVQVRFRKGRYLEENFYIRGDGTRVYFFDRDELVQIWSGFSISPSQEREREDDGDGTDENGEVGKSSNDVKDNSNNGDVSRSSSNDQESGSSRSSTTNGSDATSSTTSANAAEEKEEERKKEAFQILNLDLDKRLLVNRQRKLKMYRCWIQGRFQKIG